MTHLLKHLFIEAPVDTCVDTPFGRPFQKVAQVSDRDGDGRGLDPGLGCQHPSQPARCLSEPGNKGTKGTALKAFSLALPLLSFSKTVPLPCEPQHKAEATGVAFSPVNHVRPRRPHGFQVAVSCGRSRKGVEKAVERQRKGSRNAAQRQWKGSEKAVEMQRKGSGKAVEMQHKGSGKAV